MPLAVENGPQPEAQLEILVAASASADPRRAHHDRERELSPEYSLDMIPILVSMITIRRVCQMMAS